MDSGQQKKMKSIVSKKLPVQTAIQRKENGDKSQKVATSHGQSSQKDEKKKVHFSASVKSTPVQVKKKSEESRNEATLQISVTKEDRKRTTTDQVQAKKTKHDVELDRVLNMENEIGELSTDITRIMISAENIIYTSSVSVSDIVCCMLQKLEILKDISLKLDEVDSETQRNLDTISLDDVEDDVNNCLHVLEKYSELESRFCGDFNFNLDSDLDTILSMLDTMERERNLLQALCT